MKTLQDTLTERIYLLSITVTETMTSLEALINTALATLVKSMPSGDIMQLVITPAGAINCKDGTLLSPVVLATTVAKTFPVFNIHKQIFLSCDSGTVTCAVELYMNSK